MPILQHLGWQNFTIKLSNTRFRTSGQRNRHAFSCLDLVMSINRGKKATYWAVTLKWTWHSKQPKIWFRSKKILEDRAFFTAQLCRFIKTNWQISWQFQLQTWKENVGKKDHTSMKTMVYLIIVGYPLSQLAGKFVSRLEACRIWHRCWELHSRTESWFQRLSSI